MTIADERVSRRRLLKRAGVGAAVLGAGSMVTAGTASAVGFCHDCGCGVCSGQVPCGPGHHGGGWCIPTTEGCCFCHQGSNCNCLDGVRNERRVPTRVGMCVVVLRWLALSPAGRHRCSLRGASQAARCPTEAQAWRRAPRGSPGRRAWPRSRPPVARTTQRVNSRGPLRRPSLSLLRLEVDDDVGDRHGEALARGVDDAALEPVRAALRVRRDDDLVGAERP